MKILHLGIAVWPDWETAKKKMWIWQRSLERFGWEFQYYGVGTKRWPGYRRQKVESQLTWVLENWAEIVAGGYTHIHYTDCCDCLVLGRPEEFERKYKELGSPEMLVQGAHQLGNAPGGMYSWFDQPEREAMGRFRYPCVGGYVMETQLLKEFLLKMHKEYPPDDPRWGDDCFVWYEGFQQGWFRPMIDTGCQLWQVGCEEMLQVWPDHELGVLRLKNPETGSLPVIWHNSGGSANQETFKDHMMLPMATRLGIVE